MLSNPGFSSISASENKATLRRIIEYGLPLFVLLFLLLFSYAIFFEMPYIGFDYNSIDGQVLSVWAENPTLESVRPGDHLLQVGSLTWAAFLADNRQALFRGSGPGDIVDIRVLRGDQVVVIPWLLPGPNPVGIIDRLNGLLPPYLFWVAGTLTIFLVRPRDIRWQMLIAFFFLFAPWLLVGWISFSGIWFSRILAPALTWMTALAYLHLHWVFPRPLARIPAGLLWTAYLAAGILAVLELLQLLPKSAYVSSVMLALAGSVLFLVLHGALKPDQRRDLNVLAAAALLTVIAGLLLSSRATTGWNLSLWLVWTAVLCLPALPGAYFYVIYRRRLGGLELRANRIISLYFFLILLFVVSSVALLIINTQIEDPGLRRAIQMALSLILGMAIALLYPSFRAFIERRVLGIPLPPAHLLETYAARITTSLDTHGLVGLLRDEILPSLLVRQSALLQTSEENSISLLYAVEIAEGHLPGGAEINSLIGHSGKRLPPPAEESLPDRLGWIRLVLPLVVGDRLIGIWLLGRRDPDDYYAQSEISVLQAIANQTAVALVNIAHAELLHALYQADIERQEQERASLARGLHDQVLNRLAAVFMQLPAGSETPVSQEAEELIAGYLRDVINDLRPTMLNYGLRPAIDELVDYLSERAAGFPAFEIDIAADGLRYEPNVEQHVFRILQQACENALQHAQARRVCIRGALMLDSINLAVEDDGLGFPAGNGPDLAELLKMKRYGLMGMYERAAIIGAELKVRSQLGQGTCVEVVWQGKSQTS